MMKKRNFVLGMLGVIGALLIGAGVCGVKLVADAYSAKEAVAKYEVIEEDVVTGYQNVEDFFVEKYRNIENFFVEGYMNIEHAVVDQFQEVSDKFVAAYLAEK